MTEPPTRSLSTSPNAPSDDAEEIPLAWADDGGLRHRWDLTPRQAVALQRRLAPHVETDEPLGPDLPMASSVRRVAGVDVGFEDGGSTTRAA